MNESYLYTDSFADGSDHRALSEELIFNNDTSKICADIVILNDTDVECDDIFNVEITTMEPAVNITSEREMATVTIEMDPDDCMYFCTFPLSAPPKTYPFTVITIGLNQSNYNTSETDGSVMVCAGIIAMTGTLESNVTLSVSTSDGSATGLCVLCVIKH